MSNRENAIYNKQNLTGFLKPVRFTVTTPNKGKKPFFVIASEAKQSGYSEHSGLLHRKRFAMTFQ
ncbi:MAG: hypothetical protein LBJ63_01890 [Prevotellaceae bacterium]|jgi:hypothetical protein|nr:hypothetical protein [Prevotellaceae bacterium]